MTNRYEIRKNDRAKHWRRVRRWAYGVSLAFMPLAVYKGWIEPEASPLILPLILAILNTKEPQEGDA